MADENEKVPPSSPPSVRTQDVVAHSVRTKDLPSVNGKKEIRISISVVIGFIMMLIGIGTFASNFVFATKSEVLKEQIHRIEAEKSIHSELTSVKAEVKEVGGQLERQAKQQDVLDKNLRRLMRREGVRAVPPPNTE